MKNIDILKEKIEYSFKSMKDFDPVNYSGAETWKPHRKFENFNLTAKDLNITKKMFDDLKHFQETAWMFCDTIVAENHAERGYHILDYALHGERLNWKRGDEYWLVVNCACGGRLEIRKADPNQWTPLERFYVDKNLNLKIKIYAEVGLFHMLFNSKNQLKGYNGRNKKIIKVITFNSYPDRIEIMLNDDTQLSEILYYYEKHSSFDYSNKNISLIKYFNSLINNDKIKKELKMFEQNGGYIRHYKLYNKNNENENPEIYKNIFIKYCHDLHYRQKHIDEFKKAYKIKEVIEDESN